jgi:hypothetical protein
MVRVPLMRVSDHRLGDYDLGTGDRLPFYKPDKIKAEPEGAESKVSGLILSNEKRR